MGNNAPSYMQQLPVCLLQVWVPLEDETLQAPIPYENGVHAVVYPEVYVILDWPTGPSSIISKDEHVFFKWLENQWTPELVTEIKEGLSRNYVL